MSEEGGQRRLTREQVDALRDPNGCNECRGRFWCPNCENRVEELARRIDAAAPPLAAPAKTSHQVAVAGFAKIVCSCGRMFKSELILGWGFVSAKENYANHLVLANR